MFTTTLTVSVIYKVITAINVIVWWFVMTVVSVIYKVITAINVIIWWFVMTVVSVIYKVITAINVIVWWFVMTVVSVTAWSGCRQCMSWHYSHIFPCLQHLAMV